MRKLILFLLLGCQWSLVNCQTPYFQQQVNYKIDVTLNDKDNSLNGFEKLEYTNHSADTLHYIWFHLWPNAYKDDKTAFSDQLLQNGRTDFYFSNNDKRGYINRLDFKVDGVTARLEDHPQYMDVTKVMLPTPLPPGGTITISTPFHEQLPFNFSRGGHVGQAYQVTQWYPKPAVYDNKGWHEMPYLDQGEFYSEFGSFDVNITVPKNYVVATTGELQNEDEKSWLLNKSKDTSAPAKMRTEKRVVKGKKVIRRIETTSSVETKTLNYKQSNIHDFAWFADKDFIVRHDTLRLRSGRVIDVFAYYTPRGRYVWKKSIKNIKDAVTTRSEWLGEYPYNIVSAVEIPNGSGGMEYPTITAISPESNPRDLELTLEHEVGHNWNYGILGSNEREHPWMDEGINTFYDMRYAGEKYPGEPLTKMNNKHSFINKRLPVDGTDLLYRTALEEKRDQPIEGISEKYSVSNYGLVVYYKTGLWMKKLEDYMGREAFDKGMHQYYDEWKFRHPYPEDLKRIMEHASGRNLDSVFNLLNQRGSLEPPKKRDLKVTSFFSFKDTDKHNYLFVSPAVGFNNYDKLMIGGLIHNYTLPANKFQFFAAPMYGTVSGKLTGMARLDYHWTSYRLIRKTELSLSGATFSADNFEDSVGNVTALTVQKLVPSIKLTFREKTPRSTTTRYLQWKTFFLREQGLLFTRDTILQQDVITYPYTSRYLNQLRYVVENNRVLYPYKGEFQIEQAADFMRLTFEGKYFFNYGKGGGINVRLFAGKFLYLGDKTPFKEFATDRYHLNLTGANGYEDYTYSDYFIGRNDFPERYQQGNFTSQQIMIKDGGFKVRSDLLNSKIGKTDDWLTAINVNTDIPKNINPLEILPLKIPLKAFVDVGTFAEAWNNNSPTGKFLYDAGFQVSIIKNIVNIYVPLFYSKVYGDYFKSTIPDKRFLKTMSFSIDLRNLDKRKVNGMEVF